MLVVELNKDEYLLAFSGKFNLKQVSYVKT